jgi:RDD family protein
VADNAADTDSPRGAYPGQRLGLPPEGRGSLASWRARVGALIIDWAACMAVAVGFFGSGVLTGGGWRAWMILTVFFVESTVLSWLAGGSFGQLLSRIAVVRLDMKPLGLPRAVLRAFLVSLALPALVISMDRRGLQDLAAGTVVINRR